MRVWYNNNNNKMSIFGVDKNLSIRDKAHRSSRRSAFAEENGGKSVCADEMEKTRKK